MNQRLFIDMDGTLAKWNNVSARELYEKGYYLNLEPNQNFLNVLKDKIKEGVDIYILSAYLPKSEYALEEKKQWLDKYLPELPREKRIFVEYGQEKSNYIEDGIFKTDYLVDDYTKNLLDWQNKGGTGIKFLNGINHTNRTWNGLFIELKSLNLKEQLDYCLNDKSNEAIRLEFNINGKEIVCNAYFNERKKCFVGTGYFVNDQFRNLESLDEALTPAEINMFNNQMSEKLNNLVMEYMNQNYDYENEEDLEEDYEY